MRRFLCVDLQLTVVKVAQVSSVEKEVGSEEVPETPATWPEWQRSVQVQPAGPVHLSTQIIACH